MSLMVSATAVDTKIQKPLGCRKFNVVFLASQNKWQRNIPDDHPLDLIVLRMSCIFSSGERQSVIEMFALSVLWQLAVLRVPVGVQSTLQAGCIVVEEALCIFRCFSSHQYALEHGTARTALLGMGLVDLSETAEAGFPAKASNLNANYTLFSV